MNARGHNDLASVKGAVGWRRVRSCARALPLLSLRRCRLRAAGARKHPDRGSAAGVQCAQCSVRSTVCAVCGCVGVCVRDSLVVGLLEDLGVDPLLDAALDLGCGWVGRWVCASRGCCCWWWWCSGAAKTASRRAPCKARPQGQPARRAHTPPRGSSPRPRGRRRGAAPPSGRRPSPRGAPRRAWLRGRGSSACVCNCVCLVAAAPQRAWLHAAADQSAAAAAGERGGTFMRALSTSPAPRTPRVVQLLALLRLGAAQAARKLEALVPRLIGRHLAARGAGAAAARAFAQHAWGVADQTPRARAAVHAASGPRANALTTQARAAARSAPPRVVVHAVHAPQPRQHKVQAPQQRGHALLILGRRRRQRAAGLNRSKQRREARRVRAGRGRRRGAVAVGGRLGC